MKPLISPTRPMVLLMALAVLGAAPSAASVQAAPPVTAVAPISGDHTAVRLDDGRVLAIQGEPQVYDPFTGAWAPTGPMAKARQAFAAVRLRDGRVLVAGGAGGAEGALASAELFDPATFTWSPTGDMAVGRQFHTATLLDDGRVLVVGGQAAGHGPYYGESEIFDPATGTFAATAPLVQGRAFHSATPLADGKVLVVGGEGDAHGDSLRDGVVYDPVAATWSVVPQLLAEGRVGHTATLLRDGTVLIAGGTILRIGMREENFRATTEIYRPDNQAFVAGPSLSKPRVFHTATVLGDGRVLVLDGAGAEVYDPGDRTWTSSPAPAIGDVVSATPLGNGRVLALAGGQSSFYSVSAVASVARTTTSSQGSKLATFAVVGSLLVAVAVAGTFLVRQSRARRPRAPGSMLTTSGRGGRA